MGAVPFGVAGVAATSGSADARPYPGGKETREYAVPASPTESFVYDRRTGAFYGGPISDGTLRRGTLDDPTSKVLLPEGVPDGRSQAVGVNVDGEGRLYVACLALKCGTPGGPWLGREAGRGRISTKATVGGRERGEMARMRNKGSVSSGLTGWTRSLRVATAPCAPPTVIESVPR